MEGRYGEQHFRAEFTQQNQHLKGANSSQNLWPLQRPAGFVQESGCSLNIVGLDETHGCYQQSTYLHVPNQHTSPPVVDRDVGAWQHNQAKQNHRWYGKSIYGENIPQTDTSGYHTYGQGSCQYGMSYKDIPVVPGLGYQSQGESNTYREVYDRKNKSSHHKTYYEESHGSERYRKEKMLTTNQEAEHSNQSYKREESKHHKGEDVNSTKSYTTISSTYDHRQDVSTSNREAKEMSEHFIHRSHEDLQNEVKPDRNRKQLHRDRAEKSLAAGNSLNSKKILAGSYGGHKNETQNFTGYEGAFDGQNKSFGNEDHYGQDIYLLRPEEKPRAQSKDPRDERQGSFANRYRDTVDSKSGKQMHRSSKLQNMGLSERHHKLTLYGSNDQKVNNSDKKYELVTHTTSNYGNPRQVQSDGRGKEFFKSISSKWPKSLSPQTPTIAVPTISSSPPRKKKRVPYRYEIALLDKTKLNDDQYQQHKKPDKYSSEAVDVRGVTSQSELLHQQKLLIQQCLDSEDLDSKTASELGAIYSSLSNLQQLSSQHKSSVGADWPGSQNPGNASCGIGWGKSKESEDFNMSSQLKGQGMDVDNTTLHRVETADIDSAFQMKKLIEMRLSAGNMDPHLASQYREVYSGVSEQIKHHLEIQQKEFEVTRQLPHTLLNTSQQYRSSFPGSGHSDQRFHGEGLFHGASKTGLTEQYDTESSVRGFYQDLFSESKNLHHTQCDLKDRRKVVLSVHDDGHGEGIQDSMQGSTSPLKCERNPTINRSRDRRRRRERQLLRHKLNHEVEKLGHDWQCTICEQKLTTNKAVDDHIRSMSHLQQRNKFERLIEESLDLLQCEDQAETHYLSSSHATKRVCMQTIASSLEYLFKSKPAGSTKPERKVELVKHKRREERCDKHSRMQGIFHWESKKQEKGPKETDKAKQIAPDWKVTNVYEKVSDEEYDDFIGELDYDESSLLIDEIHVDEVNKGEDKLSMSIHEQTFQNDIKREERKHDKKENLGYKRAERKHDIKKDDQLKQKTINQLKRGNHSIIWEDSDNSHGYVGDIVGKSFTKPGFYCKLCQKFFTDPDKAFYKHCQSRGHCCKMKSGNKD
ncbi:uncharacterized protein LOC144437568 isoform X2 [Glandiceps talaboti]